MFGTAKRLAEHYHRENGHYLIELRLSEMRRLFNSFDPAPFLEKDLDSEAEDYIVDTVKDFRPDACLKLVIYLPVEQCGGEQGQVLPEAIHHYFDYRAQHMAMKFRFMLLQGRASLLIGLLFLFGCIAAREALPNLGAWTGIVDEGLLICGWVAMWRPIQIYLYDWWPIRRMQRVYEKIRDMPMEVRSMGE